MRYQTSCYQVLLMLILLNYSCYHLLMRIQIVAKHMKFLAIIFYFCINTNQQTIVMSSQMERTEKTILFNILDQMVPGILPAYRNKNSGRYYSSKQPEQDYNYLKNNLLHMKIDTQKPILQHQRLVQTVSTKRKKKLHLTEDKFFTARSQKLLNQYANKIYNSSEYNKFMSLNTMINEKISKLTNPLRESFAREHPGQPQSLNLERAIRKYQSNKTFYQNLRKQNKQIPNSDVEQLIMQRKKILQGQTIDSDTFCMTNQRLFKSISSQMHLTRKVQQKTNLLNKFGTLITYAKQNPETNSNKYRYQSLQTNSRKKDPFTLTTNEDISKLEYLRTTQRLVNGNKIVPRVDRHQRNLNTDERRLRKIINLEDYVGYK